MVCFFDCVRKLWGVEMGRVTGKRISRSRGASADAGSGCYVGLCLC